MESIQEKIESLNSLPSLPQSSQRIMALINNPASRASDVGEEIAMDPSLTAKVLRLVNSAFYGLQTAVTTVSQAIIYLGFNTIKNLALTSVTFDALKLGVTNKERFHQLMCHSIAAGFAAELLSRKLEINDGNELFTFGILHDLGKIVSLNHFTELFERIVTLAEEDRIAYFEAEQRLSDFDHTEIAEILFRKWTLPALLRGSIRAHHNIAAADIVHRRNGAILACADHIAHRAGIGSGFCFGDHELPDGVRSTLLIDEQAITHAVAELRDKQKQIKEYLNCLDS